MLTSRVVDSVDLDQLASLKLMLYFLVNNFSLLVEESFPGLNQNLAMQITVYALKFQTLDACQKGLDKQGRSRSDCL